MKSWTASILLLIGLTIPTSRSWGQAAKLQLAEADEVAHTIFLPSDLPNTHKIKKGDHIDVSATWRTEAWGSRGIPIRTIYILENIEVLDVRLTSKKNHTKTEQDGTYLVLQLTQPEIIVLRFYKERAARFHADRRKGGDRTIVGSVGVIIESTSPEQKILNKWLGAWRISYKTSKANLAPDETGTGKVMAIRGVSDQFVQEAVEHSDKTKSGFLLTYDDQKKCYRRWDYSPLRKTTESRGKWNSVKKTMIWTTIGDPSSSTTTTHRFVDDDSVEWDVVTRDGEGKVLFRMEGKGVRIKVP